MNRIVYFPNYAKKQLKSSNDINERNKPIPFKTEPGKGFTLRTVLGEDTLDVSNVIEEGLYNAYYHPDRDKALDRVIKSMESIKLSHKLLTPQESIYRCFILGDGESECWAKYDNRNIEVLLSHQHYPSSDKSVRKYLNEREQVLDKILKESAGVVINREAIVFPKEYEYFHSMKELFKIKPDDKKSENDNTYKLFFQEDLDTGWAVLAIKKDDNIDVIIEDDNYAVRNYILSRKFLIEQEIPLNLEYLYRYNHPRKSKYLPMIKDFTSDYHVSGNGRKVKI